VDLNDLMNEVVTVQGYMFSIGTALAALMVTVAGLYIMLDRDVSAHKRSERLAFVRSVLVGYGIILGANLLVGALITAMGAVVDPAGMPAPALPARHQNTDIVNWSCGFLGIDPCQDLADQVNGFFHFIQDLLAVVITIPANFTYELQGIQALAGLFRVIAFLMLTIIVMIGGFQMMIGRATGIDYVPPGEFIPRVIAAGLASYFSMMICQTFIDLTNAIVNAELAFTGHFVVKQAGDLLVAFGLLIITFSEQIAANPFVDILLIVLLILILILIFRGCARIVLIDLLIVVAPLAIVLWVLPQTRKWAAFWFTLFTTTLTEVILEDLGFCLMLAILFSSSAQTGDDLLRIIIAISAILLMTRISHLLTRMGGAGPHKNLGGAAFGTAMMVGRAVSMANGVGAIGYRAAGAAWATWGAGRNGGSSGSSTGGNNPTGGSSNSGNRSSTPHGSRKNSGNRSSSGVKSSSSKASNSNTNAQANTRANNRFALGDRFGAAGRFFDNYYGYGRGARHDDDIDLNTIDP
jgi:hypothetical protein